MRMGILADIHENLSHLRWAIDTLRGEGVDCIVFLGDVVETGDRLKEAVNFLNEAGVTGVWGNHDFGLCSDNQTPGARQTQNSGLRRFVGETQRP